MRHTLHPVASQEAVGQTRHLERPAVRVLQGQGGVLQGQDGVLQGQGGVRWSGGQVDAKADRGGGRMGHNWLYSLPPSLPPTLLIGEEECAGGRSTCERAPRRIGSRAEVRHSARQP